MLGLPLKVCAWVRRSSVSPALALGLLRKAESFDPSRAHAAAECTAVCDGCSSNVVLGVEMKKRLGESPRPRGHVKEVKGERGQRASGVGPVSKEPRYGFWRVQLLQIPQEWHVSLLLTKVSSQRPTSSMRSTTRPNCPNKLLMWVENCLCFSKYTYWPLPLSGNVQASPHGKAMLKVY